MSVALPSSPARPPAQRMVRFVLCAGLLAGVFVGGVGVGVRWHEPISKAMANHSPSPPPPAPVKAKGEVISSGESLLTSLDRRLLELREELVTAERSEREAEVACHLLRKQGMLPEAVAYHEQQQLKARATARKSALTAELNDATRLRAELLAAMAEEKVAPGTGDPELTTRIRAFVIRQELVRDPAPTPDASLAPK